MRHPHQLKRVLIVGVQQFIAFHLCSRILEEGVHVDGLFINPKLNQYQKWVDEQMMWLGRNAELRIFETTDLEDIRLNDYDVIYFCQIDPHDPEWPKKWGNEKILMNDLLSIAIEKNSPVILLSSYDIYGEDQTEIDHETVPQPTSQKGLFYLKAEKWLSQQFEKHSFPMLCVRIPTVYGPWQPPGQWMTDYLLEELAHSYKPTFAKKQSLTRDLLYVEEAVEILFQLGDVENWESSIVHIFSSVSNRVEASFEALKINNRNLPLYKPIRFNIKNVIVPQQLKEMDEGIEEQINFLKRFNPILQN